MWAAQHGQSRRPITVEALATHNPRRPHARARRPAGPQNRAALQPSSVSQAPPKTLASLCLPPPRQRSNGSTGSAAAASSSAWCGRRCGSACWRAPTSDIRTSHESTVRARVGVLVPSGMSLPGTPSSRRSPRRRSTPWVRRKQGRVLPCAEHELIVLFIFTAFGARFIFHFSLIIRAAAGEPRTFQHSFLFSQTLRPTV